MSLDFNLSTAQTVRLNKSVFKKALKNMPRYKVFQSQVDYMRLYRILKIQLMATLFQKSSRNHPEIIQKISRNHPEIIQKSSRNHLEIIQKRPEIIQKSSRNNPEIIQKSSFISI